MDSFKGPRLPILFLLYVPDSTGKLMSSIKGAIKLQKMVFILKNEYKVSRRTFTSIKFVPHKLGMYSKEIQDDIAFLKNMGLIDTGQKDEFDFDYLMGEEDINVPIEYFLTGKGKIFVEKVIGEARKAGKDGEEKINKILEASEDVKKRFNLANIRSILKYVYQKYPRYTIKSEILYDVLGKE